MSSALPRPQRWAAERGAQRRRARCDHEVRRFTASAWGAELGGGMNITGLTTGEKCLLDCVNDARDDLRKLMKRWNERLTFESAVLWEEYAKGRLTKVCYVHPGASSNGIQPATGIDTEGKVVEPIVVIVMAANAGDLDDTNRRNQQPMFIDDVDFVEGPNGIIPSNVRLYYINDEIANVATRDLNFSTTHLAYKFLPRISDWEAAILGWSAASDGDNFTGHKIQSRSKVMNCVTENKGNTFRQRRGIEYQYISTCKIPIDANTASASFEEGGKSRVQLIDVLVGPFNF